MILLVLPGLHAYMKDRSGEFGETVWFVPAAEPRRTG